jgi:hypothetical protein
MAFFRFWLWSGFAVGLGIFLASYPLGGKTPVEHTLRAWKHQGSPKLETLKDGLGDAYQNAKEAVGSERKIRERHSAEDREEVNRLISKRAGAK